MKYTSETDIRYLFRFYEKSERRYLEKSEVLSIKAKHLATLKSVAVEQSTGFYDKWGIDVIFEGDVVQDSNTGDVGIVYYDMQSGQYLFGQYYSLAGRKLEIIDNCHNFYREKASEKKV